MAKADSTIQVLDHYGNNAAVHCPACNGVFVVSSHINKKNGRQCPHCQGASVRLKKGGSASVVMRMTESNATFSDCRTYRYALWRIWDEHKPHALIIGLNPSTADATKDDPTIRRCINFTRAWGYGGLCMGNLFAYRATDSKDLLAAADPIGPDNNQWLIKLAQDAKVVIAAWGNEGAYLGRSKHVVQLLPRLHCLKINKSGEPTHPLYLKSDLRPTPFVRSEASNAH